jgi:hypothetical protein
MHQTINNVLRILVHTNPPTNVTQAQDIIDDSLATAMHTMQTTIATSLGSTPGALAFTQDMFLNVLLIVDRQAIARTCEHHVNENLQHANRKWCQYDYALRLQVLKKVHNPTKLGVRTEGPYTIECVHINGNFVKTILNLNCIRCFKFLPLIFFLHLTICVSHRWSSFRSSFCLFVYGRVILAIVVTMSNLLS